MREKCRYLSSSSGNEKYVKRLLKCLDPELITEKGTRSIIAKVAQQLLIQRMGNQPYDELLEEFVPSGSEEEYLPKDAWKELSFAYEEGEDLLGFLYLSLNNRNGRKKSGSFYTPIRLAKRVSSGLTECSKEIWYGKRILDPACGTGSILLQLPKECRPEQIFGYDIDPLAIAIVRINVALRYGIQDIGYLRSHFIVNDFLMGERKFTADVIIGNPPWGYHFSEEEKNRLWDSYVCATERRVNSSDLFIEQGLRQLHSGGILCFVVPEAVLHVGVHRKVRTVILQKAVLRQIEYLGEAFEQVQCPSVILTLERDDREDFLIGTRVIRETESFTIQQRRKVNAEEFPVYANDEEYQLLEKIRKLPGATSLKGNADFALGIVTGNNKKHLLEQRENGAEAIYRGQDVERFQIRTPSSFIHFREGAYQQMAPTTLYRTPEKLLYRFVGERPVFAYDDQMRLTLNSCNILIPKIQGMDMRYILMVLNSRMTQFVYRISNHSMKLLRSHIEGFIIPYASKEEQESIVAKVKRLEQGTQEEKQCLYDALDEQLSRLFCLTREEYRKIKQWET